MQSSGMLRRVALVRTDVSEGLTASIIRATRIGELGKTLDLVFIRSFLRSLVKSNVVPIYPILVTMMMEALNSSGTSVITRARRRNIPEGGSLQRPM
jgi:hypothetical protein